MDGCFRIVQSVNITAFRHCVTSTTLVVHTVIFTFCYFAFEFCCILPQIHTIVMEAAEWLILGLVVVRELGFGFCGDGVGQFQILRG